MVDGLEKCLIEELTSSSSSRVAVRARSCQVSHHSGLTPHEMLVPMVVA